MENLIPNTMLRMGVYTTKANCMSQMTLNSKKKKLVHILNSSPMMGHSRANMTISRVTREYYWLGLKVDVHAFVRECDTC